MSERGVFITFEGSEGCGKTTQIDLLRGSLEAAGRRVLLTREPGGTLIGEKVRHLLQHDADGEGMFPATELLLFAASRAQLVREVILPALAEGTVVISDRFMDSTTVYQGVAREIAADSVAMINHFAVGSCVPDLTFVLDLDSEAALGRIQARSNAGEALDRIERESSDFFERVREGYLDLTAREPTRTRLLDASLPRETLAAKILNHVNDLGYGISTL
ncbi:MAG: dTMP kinase [Chthoniobacterales bacterium]